MPTWRVTYVEPSVQTNDRLTEEVEANSLDVCDWCAVFVDANGGALKVIHANAIHSIEIKPQTH